MSKCGCLESRVSTKSTFEYVDGMVRVQVCFAHTARCGVHVRFRSHVCASRIRFLDWRWHVGMYDRNGSALSAAD